MRLILLLLKIGYLSNLASIAEKIMGLYLLARSIAQLIADHGLLSLALAFQNIATPVATR